MSKLILLVDDSATVQQLVRLAFEGEGIEVASATTIDSAREFLNRRSPDLLLADTSLPSDNTLAFVRELRDNTGTSHIPIILLTSASSPLDLGRVRVGGVDGVLTKPFESIAVLVATVRELLAQPRGKIDVGASDSILEIDDCVEWQPANPSPHPASLLTSLPPGFVDEVAERVLHLLLSRLPKGTLDARLLEGMRMNEARAREADSPNIPSDIDEVGENPDH